MKTVPYSYSVNQRGWSNLTLLKRKSQKLLIRHHRRSSGQREWMGEGSFLRFGGVFDALPFGRDDRDAHAPVFIPVQAQGDMAGGVQAAASVPGA